MVAMVVMVRGLLVGLMAASVIAVGAASVIAVAAPSASSVPSAVAPFPKGLTGTLLFQSDVRGPDNPEGRTHIYTIDLANGTVTAVTSGAGHRDENPRWSPDGRRIAFKSTRGGSNFDLYVMDANGANITRVTDHPANDHDPVWMPDGQSLVFSSERDSRGDLYRVWLADRRVERLTHHFVGRAIMPAVSPDGRSVAFAAQSLQRLQFWDYQVHILDLATGKTRGLSAPGGTCWPSWSPDGQLIANVALHQEPSRLEVRSPAGASSRELRPDPKRWHYYPDWSKDGRQLAFSVSPAHHQGEDWDLAIAGADGSGYQRLTTGPGNDRLPDWRP